MTEVVDSEMFELGRKEPESFTKVLADDDDDDDDDDDAACW